MSALPAIGRVALEPCVLFVDDDEANLTVFEATFDETFRLLTAKSAAEALEMMEQHEVGVLITDQRMPHTTGVELLEQVHERFPDVVRILITAYTDLGAAVAAINQGHVRRYLRKPWVPEELRAVLSESLSIYTMTQRMHVMEQRLLETERLYALGVVAASLAQELRSPVSWISDNLNSAQGSVRSLAKHAHNKVLASRALEDSLHAIDEEIADALVGLNRIMDVVRGVELPTRSADEDTSDLGEVLRLALKILRREIQRVGQVRLDLRSVPAVEGASAKLGQVVLNMLTTAVQAFPSKSKARLITVRLFAHHQNVVLEVLDGGASADHEILNRLFDPLYSSKNDGGAGLGLAISRRIAEELGGRLEAQEDQEGGIVFRLLIPAQKKAA